MAFDWNASYEWLAEEFRKETGLMAPAKDNPLCGDMHERRREWSKWFESRNEQAWSEWHERHGMLATRSTEPEGLTDEQRETIRYAASILGELSYHKTARDLIALLEKGE